MYIGPVSTEDDGSCHSKVYEFIRSHYHDMIPDRNGNRGQVFLLVNNEVDSICAAIVLLVLFREDNIRCRCLPITNCHDLEVYLDGGEYIITETEWRNDPDLDPSHNHLRVCDFVIIDCENQTSARTFCDSLPEGVTIHLISSRVHSDPTVYAPEMDRVVVWHEVPHDRAVERVLMAQARVKEDVDFMAVNAGNQLPPGRLQRDHMADSRDINLFRLGCRRTVSSCLTMLRLSKKLGRTSAAMIWLAAVALAGELYGRRIDDEQYLREYNELMGRYRELDYHLQETIVPCDEDLLVGLANTSLYESLCAASSLSGKLGWWEGKGTPSLVDVQRAIGLKRGEMYGLWKHVPPQTQQKAMDRLHNLFRDKTSISRLCFPSFSLQGRNGIPMTAGDVAEMTYAVLSSAGSLHEQMSNGDMAQAGYWFRGGHPFADNIREMTDLVGFLLRKSTGRILGQLAISWQGWIDDEEDSVYETARRLAETNVYGAIRMLLTLDTNPTWHADSAFLARRSIFAVSELAYDICKTSSMQLRIHHRVVRLDHLLAPSTDIPARISLSILYRIGLAVADILWQQAQRTGMRLLVVDSLKGCSVVIGFEVTPTIRLRQNKVWTLGDWLMYLSSYESPECQILSDSGPYSAVMLPHADLDEFLNIVDGKMAEVVREGTAA